MLAMPFKTCKRCVTPRLHAEFGRRSRTSDSLNAWCKSCCRTWQKDYREANAALVKARVVNATLSRKYQINANDISTMATKQEGKCAICRTAAPGGRWQNLHVDHDHASGRVRALLCTNCNRGLGYFQDSPDSLEEAARYLRKFA